MKQNLLGYSVNVRRVEACADEIMSEVTKGADGGAAHVAWLACLNPHSYAVALEDQAFVEALRSADWLIPDGVGVVLAGRVLGASIPERVTGSDIFYSLHQRMNAIGGYSVFFLGASEDTLALIRARMAVDYPAIRVAGTYSPPFKPEYSAAELDEMITAVNSARPDVLWVGMTAPKQEKWIFQNLHRLDVKFAGAVGAVFDFYVGTVKRSHPVFQEMGLEWLPRLLRQPVRLWRRTFVSAPIFVWHLVRQAVRRPDQG
jgi:N-acetylglucosaminyldiphosphoundecaprenol N-acetyl-beta-D-mannosaminyltransferase